MFGIRNFRDAGNMLDQILTGQTIANRYRHDLEEAKLGSGQHGFEFVPKNYLFLKAEVIEVAVNGGNKMWTRLQRRGDASGYLLE